MVLYLLPWNWFTARKWRFGSQQRFAGVLKRRQHMRPDFDFFDQRHNDGHVCCLQPQRTQNTVVTIIHQP